MDNEVDETYEAYMADVGRDHLAKSREPKPLPDFVGDEAAITQSEEPDESRLLTKQEREGCIPTNEDLEAYLAIPDDAIAAQLRENLMPESFGKLAFIILYTENIEKAQRDLTASIVRAEVLKAIEDEPEFPGDMPDEVWGAIRQAIASNNTRGVIESIMKNAVRLTKEEIIKRLALKQGRMPDEVTRNTAADPELGQE